MYTNSTGGLNNAEWGTICDDSWDIQDARVICRQLGYPDAVAAPLFARYGQGTGPIWLDNVQCLGNESDVFLCAHNGISYHNCKHDEDASAECSGTYAQYHKFLTSLATMVYMHADVDMATYTMKSYR